MVALLTLLLIDVTRIAAADPAGPTRPDDTLLASVFAIIDEEYGQPVSLTGIAARVGLSPGHLTAVVRRRTGRTVQGWATERRMSEARRLRVETDLPVHQIGQRVGIPDASYFIRSFRRAHDLTPRQWRQAGLITMKRSEAPTVMAPNPDQITVASA
jgi:AraC family transcriptional activator of pobA